MPTGVAVTDHVVGLYLYLRSHAFAHMKKNHSHRRKERIIFYCHCVVDDRLRLLVSGDESRRLVRTDAPSCVGIESLSFE